MIANEGADKTLSKVWPLLAAGLIGDILHAVIQLGYYFEFRNDQLLASGLAWCSTAYFKIP